MKKKYLFIAILFALNTQIFGKIWIISNSGETFVPADITINLGDTVKFELDNIHEVREVSQSTWQSSGTTGLPGGFTTSFGGGTILPAQLGIGTHYYVCVPHASGGMKGSIVVQNTTGFVSEIKHSSLLVFPNPTKNILNIQTEKSNGKSMFLLNDLTGKKIIEGKLNNEITSLDIENLPTGIYILVIGDTRKQYRKIVKL